MPDMHKNLFTQFKHMKVIKLLLMPALITLLSLTFYSCKTKKIAAKPNTPQAVYEPATPPAEEEPEPVPVKEAEKPAPVEKPDFNFGNIQFEFNSSVLKTASFQILDKAVREMKKDPSAKFILHGHSSAEGTPEHNMSLSIDRANSVKSYFVNAGLKTENFTTTGHGETQPATSNETEEGKVLNRRVEIKVN